MLSIKSIKDKASAEKICREVDDSSIYKLAGQAIRAKDRKVFSLLLNNSKVFKPCPSLIFPPIIAKSGDVSLLDTIEYCRPGSVSQNLSTWVCAAAAFGSKKILSYLLVKFKAQLNFDSQDHGENIVAIAVRSGHIDIVEYLAEIGYDISVAEDSLCGLHNLLEINKDSFANIEKLNALGADLFRRQNCGSSALWKILSSGRSDDEKQAIMRANIAAEYAQGQDYWEYPWRTPLHAAVRSGNAEMIRVFCSMGLVDDFTKKDFVSPLVVLAQANESRESTCVPSLRESDIVEMMAPLFSIDGCLDCDSTGHSPMSAALSAENYEVLNYLIDSFPSEAIKNHELQSVAVSHGEIDIIRRLEGIGLDLSNPSCKESHNLLLQLSAASKKQYPLEATMTYLIRAGASITSLDNSGASVLMRLLRNGKINEAEALLEYDPDVDVEDIYGNTAFTIAKKNRVYTRFMNRLKSVRAEKKRQSEVSRMVSEKYDKVNEIKSFCGGDATTVFMEAIAIDYDLALDLLVGGGCVVDWFEIWDSAVFQFFIIDRMQQLNKIDPIGWGDFVEKKAGDLR